jgi:hypothetical protein
MSGGAFNYMQNNLNEIADQIEQRMIRNGQTVIRDDYFESRTYTYEHYTPETLAKFQQAIDTLRLGAIMAQRIDWLLSCDDGEDTFHTRWNQEITQYRLLKQTP